MTASLMAAGVAASGLDVYFGTYTRNSDSVGIYRSVFDPATGALSEPVAAASTPNPSFLAFAPSGRFLYAVGEDTEGEIIAFAVEPGGAPLQPLNRRPSGGKSPCHLTVDREAKNVLAVNYTTGTVTVIPLRADGSLAEPSELIRHQGSGPDPKRQQGPHAHSVNLSPDGRYALVADLGLDRIKIYAFDTASGRLQLHGEGVLAPGAGPRHLAFHPDGRVIYVVNELNGTVTAFHYDPAAATMTAFQTVSTLPEGFSGHNLCAEVSVSADGRFLYASNRGHDSLAIFRIDPARFTLERVGFQQEGIRSPRHFCFDPSGRFCLVANQDDDSVIVFRVDPATGALTPTGHRVKVGRPVCVRFAPGR